MLEKCYLHAICFTHAKDLGHQPHQSAYNLMGPVGAREHYPKMLKQAHSATVYFSQINPWVCVGANKQAV